MPQAVEAVKLPEDTLIGESFASRHYADAYRVVLPEGTRVDVCEATRTILFDQTPTWVLALMRLRNRMVGWMGIKAPDIDPLDLMENFSLSAETIGLFRVYEYNAREALLGEDDWHLSFRVSVLLGEEHPQHLTISTVVYFNHWFGWLYFIPVRFFHRAIVKSMLRNASWKKDNVLKQ